VLYGSILVELPTSFLRQRQKVKETKYPISLDVFKSSIKILDVQQLSIVHHSGLYAHKVPFSGVALVKTVQENEKLYTPRQVNKTKEARALYEMIGCTSFCDFLATIKTTCYQMFQSLHKTLHMQKRSLEKILVLYKVKQLEVSQILWSLTTSMFHHTF
jgi:hypothetical protein